MDKVFKMLPPQYEQVARFMHHISHTLLRDYNEIKYILKKEHYFSNMIKYLNRQCQYQNMNITFDGQQNFIKNIDIWCISFFHSNSESNNFLILYEPISSRFHWGNNENFYVDDKLIVDHETNKQEISVLPQHVTQVDLLYYAWIIEQKFDLFYPLEEIEFKFDKIVKTEKVYYSNRISESEKLSSFINLSKPEEINTQE